MSTALSQSEGRNDTERSTRLPTKQAVPWPPDTTVHSLLHRVAGHKAAAPGLPDRAIIYFASIAITYVPLLLAARLSGHPLWARTEIQLPFLRDWNMAFAFLVSFPTLAVLLVTDDYVLRTSLQRVRLKPTRPRWPNCGKQASAG